MKPDLEGARVLWKQRDPRLDEAWGEGMEVTLWQLADGRYFERVYTYHIDWDGKTTERFLDRAGACASLRGHGAPEAVIREHFPEA